MRARILELLRNHPGEYLSGEEISRSFAVSRTAVWKHIRELKHAGYDIEAHSRRGYTLRDTPDRLLPDEIRAKLDTIFVGREIYYYTDVDSTNTVAKKLATAGCSAGTIVIAESQSGGRGRLARGWFSPANKGIWLSVVLRPPFHPQDAPKCTLMAAVAINRAIRIVTGVPCGIKWPNDILHDGKKLVGILTEMSAEMDAINYVVIGAGINVNIEPAEFPEEITATAASLRGITGNKFDRLTLLIQILKEIEVTYQAMLDDGFPQLLDNWRSQSVTLGRDVDVLGINQSFSGKAIDIDQDGALLIQTAGRIERVLAGDVSVRPAAQAQA